DMVRLLSDALAADGYLHPSVSSAVRLDHAPDWRRRAVAIGDDAAQRADIDTGGARASGESDVSDRMDRAELVAQRHARVLERRVDADVVEAAQTEQMRDRLAYLHHRQRRAGGRLDDRHEGGVGRLPPFEKEPYSANRFPDEIGNGRR